MQHVSRGCPSRKGYNVNYSLCQPPGSQNGLIVVKAGYGGINDKSRYIWRFGLIWRSMYDLAVMMNTNCLYIIAVKSSSAVRLSC